MKSRNRVRFTVLSALALSAACSGTPEPPLPEPAGTWAFTGVASAPIAGTMEFLPGGMVVINCDGEPPNTTATRYETRAANEARVYACGRELRVKRDEDGSLYALARAGSRAPTRVSTTCTERGAQGQCIRYTENTSYRETTGVEVRIEMTRLRGSG
jgi:hypothetical protein